jgi:hypothetical protein
VSKVFDELKSLLSDDSNKPKTGKVLRVTSSKVFLLVDGVAKVLPPPAGNTLKTGDNVTLQGGSVIGTVYRKDAPKMHYV